ncbi:MAG: four helix bundle protein [Gemmatimonadales bacterium]
MQPHERLKVWALSHRLYILVHRATATWPKSERYELTSQVRRAAFSVPANIAEGASRFGPREFRHFLDQARGSLAEVSYGIMAARDLGYLSATDWAELDALRDETSRVLWGLLNVISKRARKPSESLSV